LTLPCSQCFALCCWEIWKNAERLLQCFLKLKKFIRKIRAAVCMLSTSILGHRLCNVNQCAFWGFSAFTGVHSRAHTNQLRPEEHTYLILQMCLDVKFRSILLA